MKKKKYRLSGSYTVEASFIFPMIMSVIVAVIYLMFFVHDRCVINAVADTAALRGSQLEPADNGVYQMVEESMRELLNERLLATGGIEKEIRITSTEVEVLCKGDMPIPFHNIRLPVKVTGYARRTDPVTFIRECRVIEEKVREP